MSAGPDEKIIAVPVDDAASVLYTNVRSYEDLPLILCEQIAHFFTHYKDLEKGKVGQGRAMDRASRGGRLHYGRY